MSALCPVDTTRFSAILPINDLELSGVNVIHNPPPLEKD